MSDFSGMEDLLQDFLVEAGDLLSGVDNKLVDLERAPDDRGLLNDIFRGFHTIKGGAGFLNASELVTLCHLTENLFDKLRNGELAVTPETMDVILASTGAVRDMFGYLEQGVQPAAADPQLIEDLRLAIAGALRPASVVTSAPEVLPAVVAAPPTPVTPAPFNLFENAPFLPGGSVEIAAPLSRPGDRVDLLLHLDALVVLSACPQDMVPTNGADMTPRDVEIRIDQAA